ncbi:MAG: hypothetical protein JST48_10770 [Bacteroidetes bacterium]|nr:hypothetical protein [Bacteroidota bacterium]
MKNLQTCLLKIIVTISVLFGMPDNVKSQNKLALADSLFKAKQYTQSLTAYQSIFDEGKYTPAMLLKMAYISEGLDKIGTTLYFLKIYSALTHDDQVIKKIEELATKYSLTGYANDSIPVQEWVKRSLPLLQIVLLLVICISFLILLIWKNRQKSWGVLVLILITVSGLIYLTDFYSTTPIITAHQHTYLMDAPSAGAHVSSIISEGNLLRQIGQEDVWLKVRWLDGIVYVKETDVLRIEL